MNQTYLTEAQDGSEIISRAHQIDIGIDSVTLYIDFDDFGETEMIVDKDNFLEKFKKSLQNGSDRYYISKIEITDRIPLSDSLNDGILNNIFNESVEVTIEKSTPSIESDLPEVPKVQEFSSKTYEEYYNKLLKDDDNQPKTVRELVYRNKDLTESELDQLVEREGYSASSSGIVSSLRMLEKTTQEIERRNLDDNNAETEIVWVGEE